MASRRRNGKTHPKQQGDDGQDGFMPPDHQDRDTGIDDGRSEVVDVFGQDRAVTVDTSTGADEGVDRNSEHEGDARSMSSEGAGDDGSSGDDVGPVLDDGARTVRTARRGPGAGGNSGRGEDGEYSRAVRKRIARERTATNRERTLREQTQRELAAERTARQQQDERIARLERATTEVTQNAGVKDLESQIAALKPQLVAALEAGESAKAAEISDKLGDLKAKLEVVKYDLHQRQKSAEAAAATSRSAAGTNTTDVVADADQRRAKEQSNLFWRNNRHWANRSANKEAADDVVNIDKEILADIDSGELDFEKYSDEHFEELAARLHETYPDLEIQDLEGQPYQFDGDDMNDRDGGRGNGGNGNRQQRGPTRGGAPVNRMGNGGRRGPSEVDLARQGKVTLDQKDFTTMRTFKMDPNNKEHKKYFAKEKMRSILTGTRQSEGNS